jgi:mono/diheme cytochrome c family protein
MRAGSSKAWIGALCVSALLVTWTATAEQAPENATRTKQFDYQEIESAPAKARAKRNPYQGKSEALAAGRNLFVQHCAECHGETALGSKKAPSLRVAEIQSAEPGTIFWVLTNGVVRRGMPVWSKLPEPQRWQLVTYIKSLGVGREETSAAAPANP